MQMKKCSRLRNLDIQPASYLRTNLVSRASVTFVQRMGQPVAVRKDRGLWERDWLQVSSHLIKSGKLWISWAADTERR